MVLYTVLGFSGLVLGLVLMVFSSDKAVEHSVKIASALRISPLMIGLILVSLGTDLPEIVNSVISCSLGHADIQLGDSLGSVLAQMTLIIGLLPFLVGDFKVKRKEVLIMGACLFLALVLSVTTAEKGYFTRINAFFLVISWPIFLILTRTATKENTEKKEPITSNDEEHFSHVHHWIIALLGFVGVAIGAYVVVQSVITLSSFFGVSEYILSFFIVAIGTSLPELAVDLTAIRKKQYRLALGDAIGSCIVDASVSIGIGMLFFPQVVSGQVALITGLYAIFGSMVVVLTLALREKVDRKVGALFLLIYFSSYILLQIL